MGDKDISEKALLRYADVFADVANVLLFDGEQRILPNDLTEVDPHTYYSDKQRQNVQIQDIVKYWKKEIQHVEETLYLLSAISDDRRFEEISFNRDEEVPHNMCEILDRVEQRGFQAGYEQGKEQAQIRSLLALMSTLHLSPGQAMDVLQIPEMKREYYMERLSSFQMGNLTR